MSANSVQDLRVLACGVQSPFSIQEIYKIYLTDYLENLKIKKGKYMRRPVKIDYWNRKMETMPRADRRALQWKKLKYQLEYLYHSNPFYRKRFKQD